MRPLRAAICLLLCLSLSGEAIAEPVVDYLDPPSLARGQKNKLVLVGEGIDRAVGVWTSLPQNKLKVSRVVSSEPKRTELEIEVAADCPLGLYGLRLSSEDGLSNLQLFAVDDLLPRTALADPQKELPVAVAGEFRPSAVDKYRLEVQAGQRISFEVIASRLGTDADPLVTIFDPSGRRVAERDNNPGLFFDCCFEHVFEQAGVHTLEVRDARFLGAANWRYVLRMGSFPVCRVALPSAVRPGEASALRFPGSGLPDPVALETPRDFPLGAFYHAFRRPMDNASTWVPLVASRGASTVEIEPNDLPEAATLAAAAPVHLCGVLQAPGDKDHFALDLKKGERLFIRAETKPLHSPADLELLLFDPTGREIQRADDTALPSGALDEGTLNFTAGVDGKHVLLVREMSRGGGPDFSYRLDVQLGGPRMQLSTELAALTVPQGSYQMLPLNVVRTDYTGPIVLSLVNAPPGLKLDPAVIPEGENSVVCNVTATAGAPLGIYTLGIAAAGQAGETTLSARVVFQPLVDKQIVNVDLIKHGLRDNQRWLPPSVMSSLAVQITPPAPFTADVPKEGVVLPRYQQVELPIQTTRVAGFDGEILFSASGGQVGPESQGRRQVFFRFPKGTAADKILKGTFHSRSQANEAKERVDLVAVARHGPREVSLLRSFPLAVRPAFEISLESPQLAIQPGQSARLNLIATRLPSFSGPITVTPSFAADLNLPETITIPAGQSSVEITLAASPDSKPRRERIRFVATGQVGAFQEEPRPLEFDLEIKAPPK